VASEALADTHSYEQTDENRTELKERLPKVVRRNGTVGSTKL